MTPAFDALCREAEAAGVTCRGGFHPVAEDGVPDFPDGARTGTLVLFGFVGGGQWPVFRASAEYAEGRSDALDRWSRRIIDALGRVRGGRGLYPSDGPPWWPFQRWAMRAESVHRSPLGILIHPRFGLWHAYRGALALRERHELAPRVDEPHPCESCREKPCLGTCPVDAVTPRGYDHVTCAAHVAAVAGADCLTAGCRARRSCPVGAAHQYRPEQAGFHMRAFIHRRPES